ncbi:hypothetical protein EGW08_006670 [Elysia chlorotica]|uniref:Uncharacterized protein n=1 Tax=Elysia chlorotica TaxID=188477 RepID=A0A3S1HT47_ELYCH|nr:hypothetical protein EGW08_006670 [Elysia chlorotica]
MNILDTVLANINARRAPRKCDMSLEEALCYIAAKESRKRSDSRLVNNPSAIIAATRLYKRQEKNHHQAKTSDLSPASLCNYCGKPGHGQGKQEHAKKCPAYGCKPHHFANVCRRSSRNSPNTSQIACDDSSAILTSLCMVTSDTPSFNTNFAVPSDSQSLGFTPTVSRSTPSIPFSAMTDTGCQFYLAGLKLLSRMGFSQHNLHEDDCS